jgi:hypothetical protein
MIVTNVLLSLILVALIVTLMEVSNKLNKIMKLLGIVSAYIETRPNQPAEFIDYLRNSN